MKAADAIAEILKREGVDTLIGYPVNHIIEHAARADIRTVIVRQERIGLHMADAMARVSSGDRIGVFAMQHGPGAENAFGGIAQAFGESVPILVMPMGYPRDLAHVRPNFNSTAAFRPVTKSCEPVTSAAEIPNVLRRAFTQLRNGRPGPAVVEVPVDVFGEEVAEPLAYDPVMSTRSGPDPDDVERVAALLVEAERPVIYAGQGVHYARAWPALRRLAEQLAAPVTTSLQGKSAFPENHPLALGSCGLAIPKPVHTFLHEADLIFGIGCSFTRTNFGVSMPEGPTIVHATLDPVDLNKNVRAHHALVGDAGLTLDALNEAVADRLGGKEERDAAPVAARIASIRDEWLAEWEPKRSSDASPLSPYRVLAELARTVDPANTIITHDAGSPRDQLSPFWVSTEPLSYLGWGKTTQLGYGLGLAMGAKLASAGQALHQRVGRRGDRLHRHGRRDRGARADPDPLHPPQQLLDGDRAQGDAGLDREVPQHGHLRRLRGDGARVRRPRRAGDRGGGDRARHRARDPGDPRGTPGPPRVHHRQGDVRLEVLRLRTAWRRPRWPPGGSSGRRGDGWFPAAVQQIRRTAVSAASSQSAPGSPTGPRSRARRLRRGPNGGDKLAHRVEIAERLARPQVAREVRGAVARIERKGDEAPRLPKLRVAPEEIAPLIEKGLEESVGVQLASGLVPARSARVLAPVGTVAILHVLGDMGAEPDPKRLQPLFDPLPGRERRCLVLLRAHSTPSMSTSSSLTPKRRKPLVLNVNSRRSPCASMVAAILASWTCLPPTGTSRQRAINAAMTFGPSSRMLNDPSSLAASSSASLMASGSDQL